MEQKLSLLVNEAIELHFKKITNFKTEYLIINEFNQVHGENRKKMKNKIKLKGGVLEFPELDREYKTEVFGIYVNKYKTFSWSWTLPSTYYGPSNLTKKIFDVYYQKDIETEFDDVDFFLRNIFLTSRLNVSDLEEITLIISLSEYVLKEINKFKFIFPAKYKLSNNPEDYIIIYYCAKY
tara:strand:+ start:2007 stop:2546 length:540 start_codon:yes stop_codon:yes gene_type:complete